MSDRWKLRDVLAPDLRVVFCATAAGTQSALKRAYCAGRGNRFWRIFHDTGLTATVIEPQDYLSVLTHGVGLTDVCKTHAGIDKQLPPASFTPDELRAKIAEINPYAIAFNGKKDAQIALGLRNTRDLDYGRYPEPFGGAAAWALPSTSGAANGHWRDAPWMWLAAALPTRPDARI
ncbi:MAG: mismatch-specific DNA-glycosylase [Solirubrobacteraceae bacterium]